ncbi:MAG TPA: exodeoxyribonuclease VII small subunit [Parachlamydiales bacterium]|nr:exodeoxyribonuclease VII small subunit [Parachlamydiales bacterium]
MTHETTSFEKAFERLEQILLLMNEGKTPLEESLTLFEEAEKLIRTCTGKLNQAEQKIDMLIKGRNGEIALDANQKPKVEPYGQGVAPQPAAAPYRTPVAQTKPVSTSHTMDELPF